MDFEEILKQLKVNLLELVNNDFTDFKLCVVNAKFTPFLESTLKFDGS